MLFQRKPNPRVFQIGFSKCGTSSLHRLFEDAGLNSVHWGDAGSLADAIHANILAGRDPVAGYDRVQCFTEMSVVRPAYYIDPGRNYEVLEAWHPDALFILNTRNVDDWVRSRTNHHNGTHFPPGLQTMRERYASALGLSWDDVETFWRADWHAHHVRCRAHFRGNPNFIEWNIDDPASGNALRAFLSDRLGVPFGPIGRHNVTERAREGREG